MWRRSETSVKAATTNTSRHAAIINAARLRHGVQECGALLDGTFLLFFAATCKYVYVLPAEEPPPHRRVPWAPYLTAAVRRRGWATQAEIRAAEEAARAAEWNDTIALARWVAEGERLAAALPSELTDLSSAAPGVEAFDDLYPEPTVPNEPSGGQASVVGVTLAPSRTPPIVDGCSICTREEGERAFFSDVIEEVDSASITPIPHKRKRHATSPEPQVNCLPGQAVLTIPALDTVADRLDRIRRQMGYEGQPCPGRCAFQLGNKLVASRGMGMEVRCKRWTCTTCCLYLKAAWAANLWDRISACEDLVDRWHGPSDQGEAVKERIARERRKRGEGSYCRVTLGDDDLVIASIPFAGAVALSPVVSAEEVIAAIAAIATGATRPVSAAHTWKLPDTRTGEWTRLAGSHDIARSNQTLQEMGVVVTECSPASAPKSKVVSGVQRRFQYEFPGHWDERDIAEAAAWAEAFSVPPGHAPGDHLPDASALMESLLRGEYTDQFGNWQTAARTPALSPEADTADTSATQPEPALAPPRQLWMECVLTTDVTIDPDGRWRIVAVDPAGDVSGWSVRAYRSRDSAIQALDSGAYRLAPTGVYPELVRFAPEAQPADVSAENG